MAESQRSLSVSEIVARTGGTLIGDGTAIIHGLCPLDEPDTRCLAFLREPSVIKLKTAFSGPAVGALLVCDELASEVSNPPFPVILVSNPFAALVLILPDLYDRPSLSPGIHPKSEVDPSAVIGKGAAVGAFAVIGRNVEIGEGVIIHPQVVIYEGARIGSHTVIHSGAVVREYVVIGPNNVIQNGAIIGAEGFGYIGTNVPVPQIGNVETGPFVDFGANACADRATLGSTRIGEGTKIDNLVQIAHNVRIGAYSIICALTGIAGRAHLGNQVILGGKVGVGNRVNIPDGSRVGAMTGVTSDLPRKGDYAGYPAMEEKDFIRWVKFTKRTARKE